MGVGVGLYGSVGKSLRIGGGDRGRYALAGRGAERNSGTMFSRTLLAQSSISFSNMIAGTSMTSMKNSTTTSFVYSMLPNLIHPKKLQKPTL